VTGASDNFADPSHLVTPPEPRVACPRCGAHVLVTLRVTDRIFMSCPVCELRWIEDHLLKSGIQRPTARE